MNRKMHFQSKATLFSRMIILCPSLLLTFWLGQDVHFGLFTLLAHLLRPECQTLYTSAV